MVSQSGRDGNLDQCRDRGNGEDKGKKNIHGHYLTERIDLLVIENEKGRQTKIHSRYSVKNYR